jgi:hypothetical protein
MNKALVQINGFSDIKIGTVFEKSGTYRMVLGFKTYHGVRRALVSDFVRVDSVDTTPKAISERQELKRPTFLFKEEDFKKHKCQKVTFK